MSITRVAMIVIMFVMFIGFSAGLGYITMANKDNDTTLQNATRNAMTAAINKGSVRVSEEITINPKIATEALIRQYADSSSFAGGNKSLNIYRISSKPAMMAVESYNTVKTPMRGILAPFNKKNNVPDNTIVRQTEVDIFEAKNLVKQ